MWRWIQDGIGRRSGPTTSDVLKFAQESYDRQREELERRVQLAIAEATSRTKEMLDTRIAAAETTTQNTIAVNALLVETRFAEATSQFDAQIRDRFAEAQSLVETRFAEATSQFYAQLRDRFAEAQSLVETRFAEATSLFGAHLRDRLAEAQSLVEARFAQMANETSETATPLQETTEARIQLAINQTIAFTEERLSSTVRDVQDQRQHIPAFLNAMATVPALAFELSSLGTAQENAAAATARELGALALQIEEIRAEVTYPTGSPIEGDIDASKRVEGSVEAVEQRLLAADRRNDALVGFLKRFEAALTERESDIQNLRSAAAEIQASRDARMEGQADRGNLWKAAEQATRSIGDLWHRIEFVRKEILYEMRFGLGTGPNPQSEKVQRPTRIQDEAKVEAARKAGDVRLNLGCGHIALPDYLNVDFRDLPGVDIVADASSLPFEPGTVREIVSFHVLEHFPQEQLNRLLPYWRGLLVPQGLFRAVVPDGEAMLAHQAAGTYSFDDFRMVLFGAQEYEGDFHFNLFTPDSLGKLLTEAGFREITFPAKGRKNDISFEFEVAAIAP